MFILKLILFTLFMFFLQAYSQAQHSSCYGSIPLTSVLVGRNGGFNTLWHSFGFACHRRLLKTFPSPRYLRSEDGVVWQWHSLVSLYIWHIISSCYSSIPLALGSIGRDDGLSTLCHSCEFACQQRVLKMLPGPRCPRSEDGVVWLWHSNWQTIGCHWKRI